MTSVQWARWKVDVLLFLAGVALGIAVHPEYEKPNGGATGYAVARKDSAEYTISSTHPSLHLATRANGHRYQRVHDTSMSNTPNSSDVDSATTPRITEACIDTTIASRSGVDTVHVCYTIARDSFAIAIRFAPIDTLVRVQYIARDSVIPITMPHDAIRPWYAEPLEITATLLLGYLIGKK